MVLAVDPGTAKWGLALVQRDGRCLERRVVPAAEALGVVRGLLEGHPGAGLLLGRRTGSREARRWIEEHLPEARVTLVDEHNSTLEARRLYRLHNPPRGWRRLVPRGLLLPREPLDGYAAEVIALRFYGLQWSARDR